MIFTACFHLFRTCEIHFYTLNTHFHLTFVIPRGFHL